MRKKLSQADVGRALGISRQRVFALVRRGMPTTSIAAARAWRAENLDADTMKPEPQGRAPEAPASAELKHRLLAANVRILETKAAHENALDLPSDKVERGVMTGLQLLRASINGSTSAMYADFVAAAGEKAGRELLGVVEDWWRGVHDQAADALLLGLARELPKWGRRFRAQYVALHRGNFPDVPVPGEPRAHD